jgi:hypothetical protein
MPARALTYHFFADAFGFTERQVDEEISLDMLEWYGKITQARNRAAEIKQRQAQRESRSPRSRHF